MAGNILTPVTLWSEFKTDKVPECTVIDSRQEDGVLFIRCYIEGRKVGDERVKIFTTIAKGVQTSVAPAILLIRDFIDGDYNQMICDLVNKGYTVVMPDLAGKVDDKEFYTEYPLEISYANFMQVKDDLYSVVNEVSQTCWYEWGCVARYVIEYLKNSGTVTGIGGLGIAEAATVLWQTAAMEESVLCSAFVMNAGWSGYRGIHKYGGQVEPQFSDSMYKFIAGVDPQTYAKHINSPVLILSATNSDKFDCDRAYDTVVRMGENVYKAIHYSVGYRNKVSEEGYNDAVIFFDEFLKRNGKQRKNLPDESEIKVDFENGKMRVVITPDEKNLKEVALFVSEETTAPSERCWFKVTDYVEKTEDGYVFEYQPYYNSGIVTFFTKAYYKSGFVIGSNIVAKKFDADQTFKGYRSNVLYSSRMQSSESIFSAANQIENSPEHVNVSGGQRIKVLRGPMGIDGAYCEWGLLTFKINATKDKPNPDAMFMLDVYTKEDNVVTIKLITDYYGKKSEYVANVSLCGGDVWHNVKLEKSKFKTAEGMSLKSYDKVNAIEFNANGTWLINNALWV